MSKAAGFFQFAAPWAMLAVAIHYLLKLIVFYDLSKRVYNHLPGQCQSIAGVEFGAADVELLAGGLALFTSFLCKFHKRLQGSKLYPTPDLNETVKGKVYLYNLSANTAWELTINTYRMSKRSFNPHGLTAWTGKDGKTSVYIINHHPKGDRVEVFRLDKDKHQLNHTKTIRDEKTFINLYDIAAIGTDKFYGVNFHYSKNESQWRRKAELYLGLNVGSVVYFNGSNSAYVDRWIRTPSGIALDKTRRYLYVTSQMGESLMIYKIVSYLNGSISLYDEIPLHTLPDKVFSDPATGDVWIGAHPIKFRYFMHLSRPKNVMSPSQVLHLKGRPTRKKWDIQEAYISDGATLSGSSGVIRYKEHLMIGSLHDKMLKCQFTFPELFD